MTETDANRTEEQKETTMRTTYPRVAIIAAVLLITGLSACTTTPAPAPSPSPSAVAWPTTCPEIRQGGQIQIVAPPRAYSGLPLVGSGSADANRSLAGKYAKHGCQVVPVDAVVWQKFATGPEWARTVASSWLALPAGVKAPKSGLPLCASVTFTPWENGASIATYEPHSGTDPEVPDDCADWPSR